MLKPKTRWVIQRQDQKQINMLAENLGITPLLASLLVNRGLNSPDEAREFLFDRGLTFHDPFLLTGMDRAVNRIREAILDGEPILIFGDYDADGVTSTAIMMVTLQELGANVDFYIPNRFTEGYGPNEGAFRHAAESGIRLIITVDTGIAALSEAKLAKELGVDLIITDHHEPGEELPEALAIIHPKLSEKYPFQDLAGVGVAFKLAHALYGKVPEHLLELAAIGTVADLVPLRGENRLIVKKGLVQLRMTKRPGIRELLKKCGIEQASLNEDSIGFAIGPRINAAGRLDSADPAVHLLLTDDPYEAEMIAEEIEELNKERQSLVSEIAGEAIAEVEEKYPIEKYSVIVVGKLGWNPGVTGIVASKLVEKYYRPAIVLSFDEETGLAKGSARSIAGFDLFKNLSHCRDILPHFGGHAMAAGMTLNIADVEKLRFRINKLANEQLTVEDFIPLTELDGEICVKDVDLRVIEELQMLAPFGVSNPKPKILLKPALVSQIRKIGATENHLKVILKGEGALLDGVGFGLGHLFEEISPFSKMSAIGELSINEWNNNRKPQIFIHDLEISEWQLFDYRGQKYLDTMFKSVQNGKWLFFDEENYRSFQNHLNGADESIFVDSPETAKNIDVTEKNVVLADLPPSLAILESLFGGREPARIYAHFYTKKNAYFSTMPTREHFAWYYRFLAKKAPFDIRKNGAALAKYKGWTKETINFMSRVFLELDFIYVKDGLIYLNKAPKKNDLTSSSTYQKKQAYFALEGVLLYSTYGQLRNFFDQIIQGSVKNEEAVEKWI